MKEVIRIEPELIAQVAHETNRAYCAAIGDNSQKPWDEAEQWQRDSATAGVKHALSNPGVTPESQHQAWCDHKLAEGWQYGPVKDAEAKTHPCLVPYEQLPVEQQRKDALFRGVVLAMK
jgi:hypothetical protein